MAAGQGSGRLYTCARLLEPGLEPDTHHSFWPTQPKRPQIQRDGKEISLFDGGAGKQITKDEDCRGRGTVIIFVIYCNYYPLST